MNKYSKNTSLYIFNIIVLILLLTSLNCTGNAEQQVPQDSSNGLAIRYVPVPNQILPMRQIEIMCVATDLHDSPLTYQWSASGGTIKPQKDLNVIDWLAPEEEGVYTLTVVVINSEGTKVMKTVSLNVTQKEPQHPVIYSVVCDNCKNHTGASRFSDYILRCEAVDPNRDEIRYIWYSNIGKIKGEGNYATWTTGSQSGSVLITVIVIDSQGNEATGYLTINVACCE